MDESRFNQTVDELLMSIEDAVESLIDETDADIDLESAGGILTLSFEDNSKIIINRQTPLHQVWVATRAGGFHFNFDLDTQQWRDEKSQAELFADLSQHCSTSLGKKVSLNP
ncbi:Frataxin homolog CyaY, facilitates Fe-S cluster assembly, interacts with IscS [hydrothermal vent metagenome]|uniref:Frataxin homolog CyaY, facilitates Fe-S cluster assembly, interacts with IscS n=1 Tax=hydrothermal vent metagenome TaxID=652676 RepID=A0A3B1BAG4_9ZZZZ